jgi:hypothetical protein
VAAISFFSESAYRHAAAWKCPAHGHFQPERGIQRDLVHIGHFQAAFA